jgi:hypothetical protein
MAVSESVAPLERRALSVLFASLTRTHCVSLTLGCAHSSAAVTAAQLARYTKAPTKADRFLHPDFVPTHGLVLEVRQSAATHPKHTHARTQTLADTHARTHARTHTGQHICTYACTHVHTTHTHPPTGRHICRCTHPSAHGGEGEYADKGGGRGGRAPQVVGVVFVLLHAIHVAVMAARAARRTVVRACPQPPLSSTPTHPRPQLRTQGCTYTRR